MSNEGHLKFDLENGDAEKDGARRSQSAYAPPGGGDGDEIKGDGEYANLVRYITNFRDGRRKSTIR